MADNSVAENTAALLDQVWDRRLDVRVRRMNGALVLRRGADTMRVPAARSWLWTALDGRSTVSDLIGAGDPDEVRSTLEELVRGGFLSPAEPEPPTVGAIPEKRFIAGVLGRFADTARAGAFEDCVVIDVGDAALVLNIDHPGRVRGTPTDRAGYEFYGRWIAAAVCSDVISMGVPPLGVVVDLQVSGDTRVDAVEWLYQGMRAQLDSYGAGLAGGNLNAGPLDVVAAAWGLGVPDRLVRRGGARAGDVVIATCTLGRGWARHLLERSGDLERVAPGLVAEAEAYATGIRTPMEPILECARRGLLTSGMDLSDGVLEFCHGIDQRGRLGVVIDAAGLGRHPLIERAAELLGVDRALFALDPGFDFPYAHGYTVAPDRLAELRSVFADHEVPITEVGRVCPERGVRIRRADGELRPVPPFHDDQTYTAAARVGAWYALAGAVNGRKGAR